MNRRFEFGKENRQNSIGRFADLFDIQAGNGDKDFEQRVKSTVSTYRAAESFVQTQEDKRDIKKIKYIVTGYDEQLKRHRTMQGLDCPRKKIGETIAAIDLFKSKLAMESKPAKFVDEFGNIYEKVI